ncbi:dipeptidase [Rummeliibacillus pycnus]|uniref:dipeptidase n=1 Tax=Rummeliibacillus pycnus TaxID=101070 RepID=UPI000C9D0752|nr:dipeptidase [Rummeliibacillus pycnus]
MKIIDLHCDVLYQLSKTSEPIQFSQAAELQASKEKLQAGHVIVQNFAIFISEDVPPVEKFTEAMRQVELFHTNVLQPNPEFVHITDWKQLESLKEGQIGAFLSLEGCDAIGDDLFKLQAFLDAGVKLVGLTWNFENVVAFGAEEAPDRGLKPFGKQVVKLLNEKDIIIDVSHLNEQSFWDVLPLAKHIIASHSNARALCDHPRNLTDDQALALVKNGGHIHVVYYPPFIRRDTEKVTLLHLAEHVSYLVDLVGVENIGLGSDFDGINQTINGLETAAHSQNLITTLLQQLSKEEVQMIAHRNFLNYVKNIEENRSM